MFRLSIDKRFYAADGQAGGADDGIKVVSLEDKAADTYDLLGTDDDEVIDLGPDKKQEKGEEKKTEKDSSLEKDDEKVITNKTEDDDENEDDDEEIDELDELESELDGPDDKQLELVTPVRRKEILAKYPNLFKEFPYLEKAYYREQKFTEIYPTIDDAMQARDRAQTLDKFEGEIMRGNTENLLKSVKAEDENAFHTVVDNYLVALFNTDQAAYYHILGNINSMTIAQMIDEGKRTNNEQLVAAATVLQQFIFGNTVWKPPSKLAKNTTSPEKNSIDEERKQLMTQRYESARDDLATRLENTITATIEQNIDKQNIMTGYVKNAACKDAMIRLQTAINADRRFQSLQEKLWQDAVKNKFNKTSMDRIKSAFTTKAKTLLPEVLKRARHEALKGMGKRVKTEDTTDTNDGSTKSGKQQNRNASSSNTGQKDRYREEAKKIPRGMTTEEYLNS